MPFATHGGLAVRHTFPLDGEYVFTLRLKRNGTVSTIDGIDEDEHEIELRVDHALVKRFTIGGKFKGPDPGVLIAVPEDDMEGQVLHDYRMNADEELEVRAAGQGRHPAGGRRRSPTARRRRSASRGAAGGSAATMPNAPGVDMLYISGPFNGKTPDDTPSRQRIFTCRPAAARDEEPCARQILTHARRGAPTAGR